MADYREILKLRGLGRNHSQIAESLSASRTTVIRVLRQAQVLELDWPAAEDLSDKELANRLFPPEDGKPGYKISAWKIVKRLLQSLSLLASTPSFHDRAQF